jgi:5-methylcytosine-specific restriction endonuclease McrA
MAHKRYNTAYYQRVRKQVLERDYYTCHYCSQEATTVDHLIPISKGGTDEASNMVAACNPCNSGKRDRLEAPRINALGGTFFERTGRPTTPIGKIFPENGSAKHYLD